MRLPSADPTIEISTSSGMLRVAVHPARLWPIIALELGILTFFAFLVYENWARVSLVLRVVFVLAVLFSAAGLTFRWTGVEFIEIDSDRITLRKDLRGWERKREYKINECRELEWVEGTEDSPQGLQCKVSSRNIAFAAGITETQSIQILTALQQTLPSVAQQLCSYPEGKKHFVTLGLR